MLQAGIRRQTGSSLLATALALLFVAPAIGQTGSAFVRGDVTGDLRVTLADFATVTDLLFVSGTTTICPDAADTNDDGVLDVADAAALLHRLFAFGATLPAPSDHPGFDPTDDSLSPCEFTLSRPDTGAGADIDHIYLSPLFSTATGPGVYPGQVGGAVGLLLDSFRPLRGFTAVLEYDPTEIHDLRLEFEGTVVETLEAELVHFTARRGTPARATLFVLFDALPPFTGTFLPGGMEWHLATVRFDVSPAVDPASSVRLTVPTRLNSFGLLPITQVIDLNGKENPARSEPLVLPVRDASEAFIRGDTDRSGILDLGDAIQLLMDFYVGAGPLKYCPDAHDLDDSGSVDIADPVYALQFLFNGAAPPPAPFPYPGFDPTPDGLPCP